MLKSDNAILFFNANANNSLQEDVGRVDFEKMFNEYNDDYENFEAHYFHTLTKGSGEGYESFEYKIKLIGWQPHLGLDVSVNTRAYAHVVDAICMASRFHKIFNDFLDGVESPIGEVDLIFCVYQLSYAALFDSILEDPYFYNDPDKMEERWVNIKLLNHPGKSNPHLMKKADEIKDARTLDLTLSE